MSTLPALAPNYAAALHLIDEAHAEDPNTIAGPDGNPVPYELHYAQKMTRFLALRKPDASPLLQLACRAQHFRRWLLPRTSHPPTRAGYLTWRAKQKTAAAAALSGLLLSASPAAVQPPLSADEIARIAALVRKEGLRHGGGRETPQQQHEEAARDNEADEAEAQVLEDVACLVFLDDQFDGFERRAGMDEEKMVGILRKTWAKMSERGRAIAEGMELSGRARGMLRRALEG